MTGKRKTVKLWEVIAIYGFYDEAGRCVYVGQSWWPKARKQAHRCRTPEKRVYEFRILRWCESMHRARVVEQQVIKAYWRKGQAHINKTSDTYPLTITVEGKGVFHDYPSACRALGCCRNTIKNWAKDGYWYDLDSGQRKGRISLKRG